MTKLGSGDSTQGTSLTIKQYSDLHGNLPSTLLVTTIFFPGKFDVFGLICEDRIKVSILRKNELFEWFTENFQGNGEPVPLMIYFSNEEIGKYEVHDCEDTHRIQGFRHIGTMGIALDVLPRNPSDNTGINPDAKRKNTAPKKPS